MDGSVHGTLCRHNVISDDIAHLQHISTISDNEKLKVVCNAV